MRRLLSLCAIVVSVLTLNVTAKANYIYNGDFEVNGGSMDGWTVFQTPLSQNIPGYPKIASFDTTTPDAFNHAAKFIVGSSVIFTYAYAGLYQNVNVPSGTYTLSTSSAIYNSANFWYGSGDLFELLFDGSVVESYSCPELAPLTKYRHTLSSVLDIQGGNHQVAIRVTRAYNSYSNTPWQYVDDFSLVPEPCTLLLLGLGGIMLRKKR